VRTPIAIVRATPSRRATGQGGGKEGQYPPEFGKRGGTNINTRQEGFKRGTTAHTVDAKNEENEPRFAPMTMNDSIIKVFIVSSASDHCFTDKTLFKEYTPLSQAATGLCAGKGSTFDIMGKGTVEFSTTANGISRNISINNALYTPSLRCNMISVSKLCSEGTSVVFGGGLASVKLQNGIEVMTAVMTGRLYAVDISMPTANAFAMELK